MRLQEVTTVELKGPLLYVGGVVERNVSMEEFEVR